MFIHSNIHIHNNRNSSKCSLDRLYKEMYELYYCNVTIRLTQSTGSLSLSTR